MTTKFTWILLVVFYCSFGYAQSKASKRAGIQNKGDFRIKLLYPFAPTFKQHEYNYDLKPSDQYDGYMKSSEFVSKSLVFHQTNTLLYRGGIGFEYCFHKRLPFEFAVKTWKFRKDWDSNYVSQVGYYKHVSFPVNIRYEVFRRPFMSVKVGLGIDPYIRTYKNFAYLQTYCHRRDIFDIFSPRDCVTNVKTNTGKATDSEMTVDISVGFKITKRFSTDVFVRFCEESNIAQLNINYLLN